ncbi:hypothetical protein [uncultured Leifsonia sp.]|uniref:hypothetical protein n=1 Tax=uncultured Leifsonia sp. TaxID=340359 RepID=UPI0025E3C66A|nr:hypothetical protein [uncultured Leifsonia sp.]
MSKIIVTRLADLRIGDRILSHGGRVYRTPLRVTDELGPIEWGSPVRGVRVENPNPASGIEWVLYPSQMDGREMEVERY